MACCFVWIPVVASSVFVGSFCGFLVIVVEVFCRVCGGVGAGGFDMVVWEVCRYTVEYYDAILYLSFALPCFLPR